MLRLHGSRRLAASATVAVAVLLPVGLTSSAASAQTPTPSPSPGVPAQPAVTAPAPVPSATVYTLDPRSCVKQVKLQVKAKGMSDDVILRRCAEAAKAGRPIAIRQQPNFTG